MRLLVKSAGLADPPDVRTTSNARAPSVVLMGGARGHRGGGGAGPHLSCFANRKCQHLPVDSPDMAARGGVFFLRAIAVIGLPLLLLLPWGIAGESCFPFDSGPESAIPPEVCASAVAFLWREGSSGRLAGERREVDSVEGVRYVRS